MKRRMLQVAVITGETFVELEVEMNDKLKQIQTNGFPIMDIKFMGYDQDDCWTRAMIIHEADIEVEDPVIEPVKEVEEEVQQ